MAQKVLIVFDSFSLKILEKITAVGRFSSRAFAVKESVEFERILQNQAYLGFTELSVRNPRTRFEKKIIVPSIKRLVRRINRRNR